MRKTKVIGFSLPPKLYQQLEEAARRTQTTKSELFRRMMDVYFKTIAEGEKAQSKGEIQEADLAGVLRRYWELRAKSGLEIIIVGLGIVVWRGKVLIGARRAKDPWVENLTWVFPGGKMRSLNFAKEVQREVKEETGLEVAVKNLVAARIHPDSGLKPVQIVGLYFHCQPIGKVKPKPGGDLKQLKWVRPTEVFRYFTTSTCDEVTRFLLMVEKGTI